MVNLLSLRLKAFINISRGYFCRHPGRFLAIIIFAAASIIGIYLAVSSGLGFIISLGGIGSVIIKKLFYILFFIIFFMVALSFAVLFYALSFRSRETQFLLTLPILPRKIAFFKFIETAILACWIPALGLVIFLAGYGKVNNLPLSFAFSTIAYIVPMALISCVLGYLVAIFALRFFSLKKMVIVFVVLLLAAVILVAKGEEKHGGGIFYLLSEEVIFFSLAQIWFLPFCWASRGIIYLENGNLYLTLIYLANLWSLASCGLTSIFLKGNNIFVSLFLKHSVPRHKRQYTKSLLDKLLKLKFLSRPQTAFLIKDIKLFIREPALWLQFLVFFGLLFFYFINLRRFSYHLLNIVWKNLIVFLNMFSVLCIIAALSVRFVFPQWTLEGKSYWILKLSPLPVARIYWEKFIFSFIPASLISLCLIIISNLMLGVAPLTFLVTAVIVYVACASLVGFSLGLGAYFADFRRDYYLKAVESLGGVIALVLNLAYVVLTVFVFTFLNHLFISAPVDSGRGTIYLTLIIWVVGSALLVYILTRLGLTRLRNKDY